MLVQVVGCSHHGTSLSCVRRLPSRRSRPASPGPLAGACFPESRRCCFRRAIGWNFTPPPSARRSHRSIKLHNFSPASTAWKPPKFVEHLYRYGDEAAVQHLFTVAASLDSMVLGEPQILAQVKAGLSDGGRARHTGRCCTRRFRRRCTRPGAWPRKRRIHQRRVSVPSVAVADFRPKRLRAVRRQGSAGGSGPARWPKNACVT